MSRFILKGKELFHLSLDGNGDHINIHLKSAHHPVELIKCT